MCLFHGSIINHVRIEMHTLVVADDEEPFVIRTNFGLGVTGMVRQSS